MDLEVVRGKGRRMRGLPPLIYQLRDHHRVSSITYEQLGAKATGTMRKCGNIVGESLATDPRPERDIDSSQTGKGAVKQADV